MSSLSGADAALLRQYAGQISAITDFAMNFYSIPSANRPGCQAQIDEFKRSLLKIKEFVAAHPYDNQVKQELGGKIPVVEAQISITESSIASAIKTIQQETQRPAPYQGGYQQWNAAPAAQYPVAQPAYDPFAADSMTDEQLEQFLLAQQQEFQEVPFITPTEPTPERQLIDAQNAEYAAALAKDTLRKNTDEFLQPYSLKIEEIFQGGGSLENLTPLNDLLRDFCDGLNTMQSYDDALVVEFLMKIKGSLEPLKTHLEANLREAEHEKNAAESFIPLTAFSEALEKGDPDAINDAFLKIDQDQKVALISQCNIALSRLSRRFFVSFTAFNIPPEKVKSAVGAMLKDAPKMEGYIKYNAQQSALNAFLDNLNGTIEEIQSPSSTAACSDDVVEDLTGSSSSSHPSSSSNYASSSSSSSSIDPGIAASIRRDVVVPLAEMLENGFDFDDHEMAEFARFTYGELRAHENTQVGISVFEEFRQLLRSELYLSPSCLTEQFVKDAFYGSITDLGLPGGTNQSVVAGLRLQALQKALGL